MPHFLKVARSTLEKDCVFRLRHEVFVDEESRFRSRENWVHDRFDAFEETINFLGTAGDEPAGTARITMEGPAGLPALESYDFRPFMESHSGRFASIGWLCVRKKFRHQAGLLLGLFKLAVRAARARGVKHIISPLHPDVLPMLERLGARAIGEIVPARDLGVAIVPIHVDLEQLPFGVREIFEDPIDLVLDESLERRIYQQGETIVRRGDIGAEAFLVMRGSVRALIAEARGMTRDGFDGATQNPAFDPLLGGGQLFGEISLLDQGPRSTTVVAHSREVDVMVWTREGFLSQLQQRRDRSMEICRLLGSRLRHAIEGYSRVRVEEELVARILLDSSRMGEVPVQAEWLAGQCGLWPEQLRRLAHRWQVQGLARIEPYEGQEALHVLDPEGLCVLTSQ